MELNKNTYGLSAAQLANGTPSDKILILKSFFKDDKCTISPTKDINGRYLGLNMNIPEIKKLEMGYVPSVESRLKLYDGIEIDLSNNTWAKDWEWMQHCVEISDDFQSGQGTPGAYFYIFRPGFESAKKVSETEQRVELMNYILQDTPENLYNRVSILGVDMSDSVITDVKEFLLLMVNTEPAKVRAVYESKTFSLELMFMHAIKKGVINNRNGVFTFGEILLGVEDRAVIAYFANPNNHITTKAIEAVTYGAKKIVLNPLEDEARGGNDTDEDFVGYSEEETLKSTTLDVDAVHTEDTSNAKLGILTPTLEEPLTPYQKGLATRAANLAGNK